MPIPPSQSSMDEIERVEQQWTAAWQQTKPSSLTTLAAQITKHEEYAVIASYLKDMSDSGRARILDAGCGKGEWTIYLSDQGHEVYGVDVSRETVTLLLEQFPQYHFLCGDIRQLDFPDEFFDACVSWGVFEHFEEGLGACIKEACRVLRTGGFLFVTVPFQNWRHIFRDMRSLHKWDEFYDPKQGYSSPMRFYQWRLTSSELHRELAMRGFEVLKIRPIYKVAGISRMLQFDLRVSPDGWFHRVVKHLLRPFIPARWVSHMLIAVAKKVDSPPR